MKKCISFVSVICIISAVFLFSINVSAYTEVSLSADEDIKIEGAFNIYLSVSSDIDIGVFRLEVYFDSEKLDFKSAKINIDRKNEYMKYNISDNKVIIIYMNKTSSKSENLNDIVKLRFSPKSQNLTEEYEFSSFIYEIGDKNANQIECADSPVLLLKVSESGSKYETSTENTDLIQNSKSVSDNSAESSFTDMKKNISDNNASESSSVSEINQYSLSDGDTNIEFRRDKFYIYILAGIGFIVALTAAFKLGSRNSRRKSDENND